MHDFDYDAMQKKRIARGAAHMKRGSKSKKCSLPSDGMTAAEWKRRNGPVNTYKLDAPMSWETFKSMPLDLQQAYVSGLQNRFNVSMTRISEDLFHTSHANLRIYANRVGISYNASKRGLKLSDAETEEWWAWLSGNKTPVTLDPFEEAMPVKTESPDLETETETPTRNAEEDPELQEADEKFRAWQETLKPDAPNVPDLDLEEITAIYRGNFNPERFLLWLTKLPVPCGNVEIKVEVKKV